MATPPRSNTSNRSRSSSPPLESMSKRTRKSTRCKKMATQRMSGSKLPLEINPLTGKVDREQKVKLSSYLGTLARDKVSILYQNWKCVPDADKNLIWQDVLANFDISNTKSSKKNIISSVCLKWTQHKARLTTHYVFKDRTPFGKYHISPDEWDQFKRSRLDPSWAEKRKKAQETQAMNKTPHSMSRGGYALLEENIMADKLKKRQDEASQSGADIIIDPPSPPARHYMWKLGHTKKSGEMTSEAAYEIAQKIDQLEEEATQGTFIPHGRQDILTTAIGKPEHPGRVRTAGFGVGIRDYYGASSRKPTTSSSISPTELAHLRHQITLEVTQTLIKEFGPTLESLGAHSQRPPVDLNNNLAARVSTKGSCVVASDPLGKETHIDSFDQFELYIDENPPRLVALGRVHEGGTTIHGLHLSDDLVRVVVENVKDAYAPVPVPTTEVNLVGEALGGFIAWPRHLLKVVSKKDTEPPKKRVSPADRSELVDPILELLKVIADLYKNPLKVPWDVNVFGVESDVPLYIEHQEVLEIIQGNVYISISVLQLWISFLNKLSVESGKYEVYGFLEPQSIQNSGNKQPDSITYIMRHMQNTKKGIYMGAYINYHHWQLLLLSPKENVVVWLCSLNKKPDTDIKAIVQTTMTSVNMLDGKFKSKSKNLQWIFPKCNRQNGDYECGYYIMHWMYTIVRAGITDSWKEVFNDPEPLPEKTIKEVRMNWARYFLEIKNRLSG